MHPSSKPPATSLRRAESAPIVFIALQASVCGECREELGEQAWIQLAGERGALCLACADLDHLVYLPRGDAALTRRANKYSPLSAVVVKWSRARQRYERQGLLVAEEALARAEGECLADGDARAARRSREAERRAVVDGQHLERFAQRIRERFPGCPPGRERLIAAHACLKYSNRVGRSAAAKRLDDEAVRAAVVAHIRHSATEYDRLLGAGIDRQEARLAVRGDVDRLIAAWTSRSNGTG